MYLQRTDRKHKMKQEKAIPCVVLPFPVSLEIVSCEMKSDPLQARFFSACIICEFILK